MALLELQLNKKSMQPIFIWFLSEKGPKDSHWALIGWNSYLRYVNLTLKNLRFFRFEIYMFNWTLVQISRTPIVYPPLLISKSLPTNRMTINLRYLYRHLTQSLKPVLLKLYCVYVCTIRAVPCTMFRISGWISSRGTLIIVFSV